RHNILSLSASLSFYALFALIPLILLIFFLLSHLVFSSDYAIVKLAILTGNLVPEFSNKIMTEVYSATKTKAAWGALGVFVLLWTITPLAANMRSAFYTIAAMIEAPSYFKRKVKDVLSVLGILLLFFLFTFAGFMIEKIIRFLASHLPILEINIVGSISTLLLTTFLIAIFYKIFFPLRVSLRHLFLGACLTALLWLLMRPAFGLFLSINENYGAIFGSMQAMFVSITWLYLNFAVFLLGSELIATLRKKDVLLLKGLFDGIHNKANYIETLMRHYGITLREGETIFARGNTERNLYYLIDGRVNLMANGEILRELSAGDYFGETAILSEKPTTTDAIVASNEARIIVIYAEYIDEMMADEPRVVMQLLKRMATRLQNSFN
ncbi:MAG: YhjD/YihY/BrkB family envelope integrity protein, partial [Pseudomonadota bacterium]